MRKRLGEIAVESRLISAQQLEQALAIQKASGQPLGTVLVANGFITEELLLRVLAAQQNVGPWHLEKEPPQPDAVAKLPLQICQQYHMMPVQIRGDLLLVAMRNPGDLDAIDMARNISGMRIEPLLAQEDRLTDAISRYQVTLQSRLAFGTHIERAMEGASERSYVTEVGDEDLAAEIDNPIIGMVNQIFTEAIRMHASDIHIEPQEDRVELRFRVDGHLAKVREIPEELLHMIVTRIKIMASMDIVEHRIPQDGRISVKIDGKSVDLRVSTLPSIHGNRVVLRILDKTAALKDMQQLGYDIDQLVLIRSLLKKPYGMFLVTGPTGSGKTTTLYAGLKELITGTNNIMTCEDPVEYSLAGVNQSQVNEKVGLNFPEQLKAILRQDPDVVLVGEIRDDLTAQTAIRAAMTGHMVLSTLHANDAPSAIPRLLDMGIDPFLLSTTLIGVLAQRLVRELCPTCKVTYEASRDDQNLIRHYLGEIDIPWLYRAEGCVDCDGIGYRGRVACGEVLPIDGVMREGIAARDSLEQLRSHGRELGYRTMQQDALAKVLRGITSLDEVQRTIYFDTNPLMHKSGGQNVLRAA